MHTNLGGRGQEALHDRLVHLDGGTGHDVAERLDLLEVLQLHADQRAEDALDLRLLHRIVLFTIRASGGSSTQLDQNNSYIFDEYILYRTTATQCNGETSAYGGECHVDEVEARLQAVRDVHAATALRA